MNKDDFNNSIIIIDNKFKEENPKGFSTIDDNFEEAKRLFLKIYDEYINSEGFKGYLQERQEAIENFKELEKIWKETEAYNFFSNNPDKCIYKYPHNGKIPDINRDDISEEDREKFYNFNYEMNQMRGPNPDFSVDKEKYEMKIDLLKKYLGVNGFPSDWYHMGDI